MTMLDETIDTAKHAMGSAQGVAGRASGAAKQTVESAKEVVDEGVSGARTTWLDAMKAVTGVLATIRSFQTQDALGWFGLQRRQSPFVSLGVFGAGVAVGTGLGFLFAPASGTETRQQLMRRLGMLSGSASKATTTTPAATAPVDTPKPNDTVPSGIRDAGKSGLHRSS